jgi:hypothetical protein
VLPVTGEVMEMLNRPPDLKPAALASPALARSRMVRKKLTGTRSHAAIPTGNPAVIGIPFDR